MDHDSYYYASLYQDEDDEDFDYGENKNEEMSEDALLISLVRDHPYLYNKELTDFKDTIKKQNAWVEIASIMNMTVEECQTRWIRLRERYSREKKQQQEETTTGSGVSKRKTFEFFDNMQFLERFVKRRRTLTNMPNKNVPPGTGFSNLQKNFNSHNEKENNASSINVATSSQQSSKKSIISLTSNTVQHVDKAVLTSSVHLNFSDSSSTSATNVSSCMQDKSFITQQKKTKEKPDVLESAIGKVISLLENRCALVSSSPSFVKPEIEEDLAFGQLVFSSFVNMPQETKADKRIAIMHILYNK
ncbi:transcription factor Adf-1-like [Nylanderia fulva]|uniref:transcription factor Adf-1-like n=1 Tax=Nylanderia fulva TaxID=613905 RepID=UPI0010FB625B|nr:transcription factor Adf-1-like [Nylanderia fulva]